MGKHSIEIIQPLDDRSIDIKAALFDFDGTLSILREGWEDVMEPLMVEMISDGSAPDDELITEVREYIDESTGIQTIFQMRWLVDKIKEYGFAEEVHSEWWYKDEYNRRLMEKVNSRIEKLNNGEASPKDFLVKGSEEFLQALSDAGIELYIASGTDHGDVVKEVNALGLGRYFSDIAGAPERRADCSKEMVIKQLIEERGLKGDELVVIGDGKVEIGLAIDMGAVTLGLATDEIRGCGLNLAKRKRLIDAGAHAIATDFSQYSQILEWLGI